MSCSQFIEHEDEDKSDTLVIIVNGDGTVNVDPRTLERVLKHQVRAAVSVVTLEESNEPDSQAEKVIGERNEKSSDEKDSFCHKVNLVVEGYYPPPPLNSRNMSSDSVVSSTVSTPPLPQTPAEFFDLLAEGLEIPVTQSTEGCIGDSLVDAFSEMAPEQLKQVETALHSEKAKQILGDGVASVLDTLMAEDDTDDWVHFDHCYTANCYGTKKPQRLDQNTIEKQESSLVGESDLSTIEEIYETLSDMESGQKTGIGKKKVDVDGKNAAGLKVKTLMNTMKEKRSPIHIISKVKKKASKNDPEPPPERVVKDDEVDGVKVFKPIKSDKRLPKFPPKDNVLGKTPLVQTKLNFGAKKEDSSNPTKKSNPADESETSTPKPISKNGVAAAKKDAVRKPVTSEVFGPALFSTPDIIRKIGSEDASKGNCNVSPIDTADLEKRMSAIENGELLDSLTLPYVETRSEPVEDKIHAQDDSRLLSDLENSADELSQAEYMTVGLSNTLSDLDSPRKQSVDSEQSDFSDKNDVEYEDDPNKLWCICSKPHNNRFMICCDACDNWFHGYCVGITKAMGEKMEQNGTEWLCPGCKKEKTAVDCDSKPKFPSRSLVNRSSAAAKRRSSQAGGGDSANSSVSSITSTSVDMSSSVSQNISTERSSVNQASPAAVNRRKSSSLPSKPSAQLCIMCKENEAMPDGLYCTNACIVLYVAAAIENMNSQLAEPLPEDQRIIMQDRKRDHVITGMRGPAVSELTSWLAEHPSFEIMKPSAFPIRPGRELKPAPKPINEPPKVPTAKVRDPHSNVTGKPKPTKPGDGIESSQTSIKQFFSEKSKLKKPVDAAGSQIKAAGELKKDALIKSRETGKDKQRPIKLIPPQPKPIAEDAKPTNTTIAKSSTTPKPVAPTPATKKPTQTPSATEKTDKTAVKRKAEPPKKEKPPAKKPSELKRQDSKKSEEDSTPSETPSTSGVSDRERIRKNIRIALNELFISRMKDVNDISVQKEELTTLATQVEEELFNLFNDTNTKYKSKYRSLRFNIKDEKNTLFRRIAERSLRPYDLVRLTPEEMASTELAQWREREAKHELDMIKKTELENLSQAKVLVLKTHKGELEIEAGALPMPETVVPDLHPDELPVEADKSKKSLSQLTGQLKTPEKDSSKDTSKKDRDKSRHKKHDHKDKHKSSSSHKHRHRSSERHRSRSRKRSTSKESKEKKDRSNRSSADKKHDSRSSSDKDRHRSRGEKHRSRSRSRRKDRSVEKKEGTSTSAEPLTALTPTKTESLVPEPAKEISAMIIDKEDEKIAAEILSSYNTVDVDLSDMEPTSTVTIQTPPYAASPELPSFVWKGTLVMPDVTKMHVRLKEVSGNCDGLDEDLAPLIECVGRINPSTVWDYISKTKKTGSREILVLRFEPVDEEQRANYFALYSYLNRKDRMAVVGSNNPSIKDFYVIPLAGHSPIPQVLLPLDGPGFEDSRSHMLLGVIVRSRRHSHHHASASLLAGSHASTKKEKETHVPPSIPCPIDSVKVAQSDTFTPPHSPTSVFVGGSTSPPVAIPANDDDEPYSPEDDEPYSPSALDEEHENDTSLELQREMEAINRQIEEQRQQIESISSSLPQQEESAELYSPTQNFISDSDSSNVQLPGDLQQLLNSLNRRTADGSDPIVNAYKEDAEHLEEEEDDDEECEEMERDAVAEEDDEEVETDLLPHYSPPDMDPESDEEADPRAAEMLAISEIPTPMDPPEVVDESRLSRDPRRKPAPVTALSAVGPFPMLTSSQPPPPGMENEFSLGSSGGVTSAQTDLVAAMAAMVATTVADPAYVAAVSTAPFVYSAPITSYPPPNMLPTTPMYIPPPGVFPQAATLPFAAIPPPQQMYIAPTSVLPSDPSMIPLPVEPSDRKRRSQEDDKDREKDRRTGRKYRDSKSPPGRDGYDSHHRNYRRDDDRDSRYGHGRHDRNYRSRSGYWKGSGDYSSSSSSSSRRKYSDRDRDRDRRSSSRERSSSSKHGSRWDSASKHGKEDWDDEKFDSRKRDKSDRKSESSSSK